MEYLLHCRFVRCHWRPIIVHQTRRHWKKAIPQMPTQNHRVLMSSTSLQAAHALQRLDFQVHPPIHYCRLKRRTYKNCAVHQSPVQILFDSKRQNQRLMSPLHENAALHF